MRALKWLLARLDRPRAAYVVILVALVLALPSIVSPFFVDEHLQASKQASKQVEGLAAGHGAKLTTHPQRLLRLHFDHLLWPGKLAPIHLHSLLWMRGTRAGLAAWTPPQVGETVELSAAE